MNNHNDGLSDVHNENLPLAQWVQQVLAITPQQSTAELASITDNGGQFGDDYHMEFYQQLPDFALALLHNDTQATIRYAPLLFHLTGCRTCHAAYLEIYDAMRATVGIGETHIPIGQWSQSMANTSTRMLVYLCRLLINQAQEIVLQSRHDHTDNDTWVRSLLQQAIHISSHLMQSILRQRALQELVKVATLFDDTATPATHSYAPVLSAGGGSRYGSKIIRRAETLGRPLGQPTIYLQSGISELEGTITQNQDTLELHLEDLGQELRGHFLTISVPLGSLLEPVRWIGGNPHSIRSQVPVSEDGKLTTPLGYTDLRINDPEDHNLLEAMFRKIDVRLAN
jgi:hypothetical protein